MNDWIKIGTSYVTENGRRTGPVFQTPAASIYRSNYPFAAYFEDNQTMHFWDADGFYFRKGSHEFALVDEIESERKPDEELDDMHYENEISFLYNVKAEVKRAREKFSNDDLAHAMTEEFGEVIKALMDQKQKKTVTSQEIYDECVQAAAMAMRVALDGDPNFPDYSPPKKGDGK